MSTRLPFFSRHPLLFKLRVSQRRLFCKIEWIFGSQIFATTLSNTRLSYKVYRHQSKLKRYFSGDRRENIWQDNKVHNHCLALPYLNGILIKPGETLSLWKAIGCPTQKRGFREGMELSMGKARGGIGGGLCQIANLVHWIALHSPLKVTKRSSHSFDPFPDQGRVIPYGTGAALFYNFVDLWIHNPTNYTFQLRLWLSDTLLNGELRCEISLPYRYRVFEKHGRFEKVGKSWMRHNEIWRETIMKGEGARSISHEKLYENHVQVLYTPRNYNY